MSSKKNNERKEIKIANANKNKVTKDKKLIVKLFVILFVASFFLYSNTLHHSYVLDDTAVIKENTLTKAGIHSVKEIFASSYRTGYTNNDKSLYRPLSKAMFAIEWQLAPDKPFVSHLVNVLFYAFTCVLLFFMLQKYITINVYILFFASLLFTVHPIHTEVVANIKSRDEIMSTFFLILSLLSIDYYLVGKKIISLLLSLICFFLALLSKESAIIFVAIIPLFLYFFKEIPIKKNLVIASAFLITALGYLLLHLKVIDSIGIPNIHPTDNPILMANSFFLQKATAIYILGKYLLLLLFPHPLSCDYSFNAIPVISSVANLGFLFALIIHVFLLIYAIVKIREKHFISFCILFYLISMAIASNIFLTIGTNMAERLLFFPSIAFCLAIAYYVAKFAKIDFKSKYPTFKIILISNIPVMFGFVVILVLLSFKTVSRNKDWKDSLSLFEHDLKTVPNSTHLLLFHADNLTLKESLVGIGVEEKKNRFALAKKEIEKAISIYEPMPDAHTVAGRIWYEYENYDLAYKEFSRALYLNPQTASYHNNVASCLFATGKYKEAAEEYKKTSELNPKDADAFFNLGSSYGELGQVALRNKDNENANRFLHLAIDNFIVVTQINTNYKSAFQFLGLTYKSLGDTINAQKYFTIANQLN